MLVWNRLTSLAMIEELQLPCLETNEPFSSSVDTQDNVINIRQKIDLEQRLSRSFLCGVSLDKSVTRSLLVRFLNIYGIHDSRYYTEGPFALYAARRRRFEPSMDPFWRWKWKLQSEFLVCCSQERLSMSLLHYKVLSMLNQWINYKLSLNFSCD